MLAASLATSAPSTGSEKHMIQARTWVDDCVHHHPLCHATDSHQLEYPSRLLFVVPNPKVPGGPPKIRLESIDKSRPRVKYLALSHCWGGASPFKLKHANFEECSKNIDYQNVSKNIQDAVQVVQNLGFSYLWVDSLCIIQDCYHDWKREGSKMGDIYAGAFATIASTGAATSDGGCFHERAMSSLKPCQVGISSSEALLLIRRDDISDFRRSVDHAPLNQRGWVLQERLLSHRILHFGADMMYWECAQRSASELNPAGYVYKRYPDELYGNFIPAPTPVDIEEPVNAFNKWTRTELVRRRLPAPDLEGEAQPMLNKTSKHNAGFWKENRRYDHQPWSCDKQDQRYRTPLERMLNCEKPSSIPESIWLMQCWYDIVETYTRAKLSFSSDRTLALAGIVGKIKREKKLIPIAGLWAHCSRGNQDDDTERQDQCSKVSENEVMVSSLLWIAVGGTKVRLVEKKPPKNPCEVCDGPNPPQESAETAQIVKPSAMAPTWSWVGLDAVISQDLYAENTNRPMSVANLLTRCVAVMEPPANIGSEAQAGVLKIRGPLVKVSSVRFIREKFVLSVAHSWRRQSGVVFWPDCAAFQELLDAEEQLYCLACLEITKERENTLLRRQSREIQGLVLVRKTPTNGMQNSEPQGEENVFERVGFFTTENLGYWSRHMGLLRNAPLEELTIM
ncbi:hypothetical protein O1611_g364 [Lasiodiplodia mahajangana]|uniref:Uncharacterized protein n=1 Tax=Lasiodiplodia mahajangana TaxID=1108764 RepID=A0ACC2K0I4_9PEZI|nr:hypothetical protein O1611_g364 [Lasiodiplodia mahajangana]